MFWKALEHLHSWEREHFQAANTLPGREVLIWLLKFQGKPRPLKDLYRSSQYSEPTIRSCLRILAEEGFIAIEPGGPDHRTRYVRMTPKLELAVRNFEQRFHEAAIILRQADPPFVVTKGNAGPGTPVSDTGVFALVQDRV